MARRPEARSSTARYYLGFAFTAVVLGGLTLFLVLFVLPRRYVLSAGLREAGVSFPSEAAPFSPAVGTRREAAPLPPPPVVRGRAEILWYEVGPLLEADRFHDAIPTLAAYLAANPEDRNVRREYAITLSKAGRPDLAVAQYQRLLPDGEYPGLRLLTARTLRDAGRMGEATPYYASLLEEKPADSEIGLEWARGLAWSGDYGRSASVLEDVLSHVPHAVDVQVALAEVFYWAGRLEESEAILAELDAEALETAGATQLKTDVLAALTPPEAEGAPAIVVPPTTRERAQAAVGEKDFETAAALYWAALDETPDDAELWIAYADVFQYGLEDLEGARNALLMAEALETPDGTVALRLAQLAIWTGRNDEGRDRLEDLLAVAEPELASGEAPDSTGSGAVTTADMRAMLGDVHRWRGDREASDLNYRLALAADPMNVRAVDGLAELTAEIHREIQAVESPGLGGMVSSLADSDKFSSVDLGVGATDLRGDWVWNGRTGSRWIGGLAFSGLDQSERGFFLDLESARWWKLGTVRTGMNFGVENVRPDGTDFSLGGSLRFTDLGGFRTDVVFHHGPAYPLTVTLQSMLARTMQDRLTATLARALADRWSLVMVADAAWLDAKDVEGSDPEGSLRFEGALSLDRRVAEGLVIGANGRAMGYSNPSPVVDDLRLFWDPRSLYSTGLYAGWSEDVRPDWSLRARVNPSLAWIDEREAPGFEMVPHFSAEAGFTHTGSRFRTGLDVFYYQGRFDGYRAYGLSLSFSAIDWFGRRSAR